MIWRASRYATLNRSDAASGSSRRMRWMWRRVNSSERFSPHRISGGFSIGRISSDSDMHNLQHRSAGRMVETTTAGGRSLQPEPLVADERPEVGPLRLRVLAGLVL